MDKCYNFLIRILKILTNHTLDISVPFTFILKIVYLASFAPNSLLDAGKYGLTQNAEITWLGHFGCHRQWLGQICCQIASRPSQSEKHINPWQGPIIVNNLLNSTGIIARLSIKSHNIEKEAIFCPPSLHTFLLQFSQQASVMLFSVFCMVLDQTKVPKCHEIQMLVC